MPRSIISTERAFVISYKGNADIVHEYPKSFKLVNPNLDIKKPSVIRVFNFINVRYQKVPLNRKNIFKRDNYECVYCGSSNNLTLDHVIPKSKGGENPWDNLVTACQKCNLEKADLDIEEWGKPHPNPKRPHYLMLLKNIEYIPEEWKQYLLW